jgi:hypothetical protein
VIAFPVLRDVGRNVFLVGNSELAFLLGFIEGQRGFGNGGCNVEAEVGQTSVFTADGWGV